MKPTLYFEMMMHEVESNKVIVVDLDPVVDLGFSFEGIDPNKYLGLRGKPKIFLGQNWEFYMSYESKSLIFMWLLEAALGAFDGYDQPPNKHAHGSAPYWNRRPYTFNNYYMQ